MSFRSPCSVAVINVRLDRIEVANGRSVVSITINMTSMDNLCVSVSVLYLALDVIAWKLTRQQLRSGAGSRPHLP